MKFYYSFDHKKYGTIDLEIEATLDRDPDYENALEDLKIMSIIVENGIPELRLHDFFLQLDRNIASHYGDIHQAAIDVRNCEGCDV